MYYELYVDILFLVNFVMDYIILLLVWKISHCETKMMRIFAGAAAGAFLTCILIILPIPNAFLEALLFHLIVNSCMVHIGFRIKKLSLFLRTFILLYIVSILMGGVLELLDQHVTIGSLLFVFAILGYYLCLGIWNFLSKLHRWNNTHVKVKINCGEQEVVLDALIDTGNCLYDPKSGKPISIMSAEVCKKYLTCEEPLCYVFLQTLAQTESCLPVFCVDSLQIMGENEPIFRHVLMAVSDAGLSKKDSYQVILNPNLF